MALMPTPTTQAGHWPAPAAGEWTVDMLRELPDDGRRYELLDGVLVVSPAPAPRHQLVAAQLFRLLDAITPADHRVFFAPVDWQPDERTSLEPDLLIISRDAYHETGTIDTPVAVLEIASPSTARMTAPPRWTGTHRAASRSTGSSTRGEGPPRPPSLSTTSDRAATARPGMSRVRTR
jgi:Uma2 family endonuclease